MVIFLLEIAKIVQQLEALPPDPIHNTPEEHQSAQHAAQISAIFFDWVMLTFGSNPLAKSWLQL